MTYLEVLQKEKRWYKRVLIIHLFHNRMLSKRKVWPMRMTAQQLHLSLGGVSESLKLAKAVMEYPQLEFTTRQKAMKWVKGK